MNGANIGNLHDCDVTISSSVDEKSEVQIFDSFGFIVLV